MSMAPQLIAPLAGGFLSPSSTDTWVLVAFIIFLGILYFAGVPRFIAGALDDRAANIRRQLEEARQLREEAQSKLAEWQRKQREVETQAGEIVDAAKREAERAAEDAKRSIADMVDQRLRSAREQVALAEAEAVRRVRNEAVDAAIAATADVLKRSMASGDAALSMDSAIAEVRSRLN